jgi:hypothetical protein
MWINLAILVLPSGSVCVRANSHLQTVVKVRGNDSLLHEHSHVRIDSSSNSAHSLKVGESSVVQNHTRISTCRGERVGGKMPDDLAWNGLIFCSHKELNRMTRWRVDRQAKFDPSGYYNQLHLLFFVLYLWLLLLEPWKYEDKERSIGNAAIVRN